MSWTKFMDMHSGGGSKEPFQYLYIEAPKDEAKVIFYNRFGHNPDRVTCTCCGEDYSIGESETLEEATWFNRGTRSLKREFVDGHYVPKKCWLEPGEPVPNGATLSMSGWHRGDDHPEGITVEEYLREDGLEVIRAHEITPAERTGDVPDQGYVWRD